MILVVTIRVRDGDPVEGSVKRKCLRCAEDCWVSPGSQKVEDAEVVCADCVGPVVGERVAVVRSALLEELSK